MQPRLGAALIAEFVGSFGLTFVGIMSIYSAGLLPSSGAAAQLLMVALAHGLVLGVMVSACMPVSGGHINPAITIGFLITGRIKPAAAIAYILFQLVGGVVAALAVLALFGHEPGAKVVAAGTPELGRIVVDGVTRDVRPIVGLLCEIIATFFLAFAVWGTAADPRARNVGGFAIGLTIAFDILAVGTLSGASMNPQRSFGPTLVAGGSLWHNHWIYWVGPILGASLAALVYHLILWPRDRELPPESGKQ